MGYLQRQLVLLFQSSEECIGISGSLEAAALRNSAWYLTGILILVLLPSCPRESSLVLGWGASRKAWTLQGVRSSGVAQFPYAKITVQENRVWSTVMINGAICFTRKSNCLDKLLCSLENCAPKILVSTLEPFTVIQLQTEACKSSSSWFYTRFFKLCNCCPTLSWDCPWGSSFSRCLWHAVTTRQGAQRLLHLSGVWSIRVRANLTHAQACWAPRMPQPELVGKE